MSSLDRVYFINHNVKKVYPPGMGRFFLPSSGRGRDSRVQTDTDYITDKL